MDVTIVFGVQVRKLNGESKMDIVTKTDAIRVIEEEYNKIPFNVHNIVTSFKDDIIKKLKEIPDFSFYFNDREMSYNDYSKLLDRMNRKLNDACLSIYDLQLMLIYYSTGRTTECKNKCNCKHLECDGYNMNCEDYNSEAKEYFEDNNKYD